MKKRLAVIMSLSFAAQAQAQTIKSFDELWSQIYQKSYQQKSVAQEKEANDQALSRAQRHWLPRAYVAGQWFSTNDPGQVFFNHLGQRSVEQADFVPSTLNQPNRSTFKAGVVGVDLPLYEGGMKSNQSSMYKSLVKASEMEMKAKKSEEYGEFGRQYGGLMIYTNNNKQLQDLKAGLDKIIGSYQVGAQSNPVGYSGLLGLKGVGNRIEGMVYEYEMKMANAKKWIDSKAELNGPWTPAQEQKLETFLVQNLSQSSATSYSSMLLAQDLKVQTLDNMKDMEKARYLPRVGLFAQNNIYSGSRDTANSQSYGLYLMWDLFNSDSYGRVGEANAKAMAGKAKLEAYKQEERIMMDQLLESKATLEKNLALIEKSDQLLKEQSVNAMKLFRSGMLSALQLAEVINRRVDLIKDKAQAESQYLEVYSRMYQLKN